MYIFFCYEKSDTPIVLAFYYILPNFRQIGEIFVRNDWGQKVAFIHQISALISKSPIPSLFA
jgi:hypothetical protein